MCSDCTSDSAKLRPCFGSIKPSCNDADTVCADALKQVPDRAKLSRLRVEWFPNAVQFLASAVKVLKSCIQCNTSFASRHAWS